MKTFSLILLTLSLVSGGAQAADTAAPAAPPGPAKAAPSAPSAGAPAVARGSGAASGRDAVSMCIGCHSIPGYKATFPQVYRVPMIAGQSAKYIEAALIAYRKGERAHPTMVAIAKGLSDEQMAAVAGYFASLGPETH